MSTMTTLIILFAVLYATLGEPSEYSAPGGYRVMDVNSFEAQSAGRLAAGHLERQKNSFRAYRLHRLISAEKQVVQGTNYRLELILARTNCYRGETVSLEKCRTVKVQTCNATIHLPLQWQPSRLLSGSCGKETAVKDVPTTTTTTTTTTSGPIPGGIQKIDVKDKGAIQAASFATQQLTEQSNGQYRVENLRIIKATSQVVAGSLYRLSVAVSLAYSGTNEVKSTQCEVTVWDQPWRNPRYILDGYNCDEFIA